MDSSLESQVELTENGHPKNKMNRLSALRYAIPKAGFSPNPFSRANPDSWSYRFNNPSQTPWQRLPTESIPDPYPVEVNPNETYPRKGETLISFIKANLDLGSQQHSWIDRFRSRAMIFASFALTFWIHSKMSDMPAAEPHTHEEHHRSEIIWAATRV